MKRIPIVDFLHEVLAETLTWTIAICQSRVLLCWPSHSRHNCQTGDNRKKNQCVISMCFQMDLPWSKRKKQKWKQVCRGHRMSLISQEKSSCHGGYISCLINSCQGKPCANSTAYKTFRSCASGKNEQRGLYIKMQSSSSITSIHQWSWC